MRRTEFRHALNCLAHPVSVIALLLVAINDLWLQPYWPSWWTGKLGDAAWMVFAPFLVAGALVWLLPTRRGVFPVSLSIVCAGLIAVKAVPAINLALVDLASSLNWTLKLSPDPTDLVVLPAGLISWLIWNREFAHPPGRAQKLATLAFAALVTLSDMAPPPAQCVFLMPDGSLIAKAVHAHYRSEDGGLTWVRETEADRSDYVCDYMEWPVTLGTDPPLVLYYDYREGLYQTTDGAQTLIRVHVQPGEKTMVQSAVVTSFDTLVLALGDGSFATRLPDGEWLRFEEQYPALLLEQITDH
jgi:hypothetical protein